MFTAHNSPTLGCRQFEMNIEQKSFEAKLRHSIGYVPDCGGMKATD